MIFDSNNEDDSAIFQMGISGYDDEVGDDCIAQEFHALAFQSLSAAETLDQNYLNPIFILLCHALELSLKSYLLTKGVGSKKLIYKYRHNIEKLLTSCKDHGLLLSEDTLSLVKTFFYDLDEDRNMREDFSNLSDRQKKAYKLNYEQQVHAIVEECKNTNSDIPYDIQIFRAHILDDKNAKLEIDSEKYKSNQRKVGRFTNIRYKMESVFPPRISSQRAIREVIDKTEPNYLKNNLTQT